MYFYNDEAVFNPHRLLAGTHLEGGADLIGGEVVNDQVNDLLDVVVNECFTLLGDRGWHVRAEGFQNVPKIFILIGKLVFL